MNRTETQMIGFLGIGFLGIGLLGLIGCGPKKASDSDAWRTEVPAPLAPRPFAVPDATTGTLSNGLSVSVVSNHEVPKVYVTLAFRDGGWTDPTDRPGLASVSMDMLNEGAGTLDAEGLSLALRRLASDLGTSASSDGATITLSTLKKNLGPSLDLLTLVLTQPTFPTSEWEILRNQRIADLRTELEDPGALSRRAFWHTLVGPTYLGLFPTEASYQAMRVDDMRAWASAHLRPDRAVAMVGGDITLDEIQPLLEARLQGWKATGAAPTATPPAANTLRSPEKSTIYLVDKPGASQSVLRFGLPVGERTAPDSASFAMANDAIGGMFTARVNMKLREEKGYTYGARSFSSSSYLPDVWMVNTNVRAVTVDSANAAWKARIDPNKLVIVVVGDAASLREGLATLNLPIVELDRDGNPLGK